MSKIILVFFAIMVIILDVYCQDSIRNISFGKDTFYMLPNNLKYSDFEREIRPAIITIKDGRYVEFNSDSSIFIKFSIKNNKLDDSLFYFFNGKLSYSGFYKNGNKYYSWKSYKDNVLISTQYWNNNIVEESVLLYKNGQDSSTNIRIQLDNDVFSWHTEWYNNGLKKEEGCLKGLSKYYQWKYWYENGTIEKIELYRKGDKDGVWQQYDISGFLIREENYRKGKLLGINEFFKEESNDLKVFITVSRNRNNEILKTTRIEYYSDKTLSIMINRNGRKKTTILNNSIL